MAATADEGERNKDATIHFGDKNINLTYTDHGARMDFKECDNKDHNVIYTNENNSNDK